MKIKIPETLRLEHDELHNQLAAITQMNGEIGEAAKYVAKLMHPHFIAEEEFAIPPLGVLSELVSDKMDYEIQEVLKMTDKLSADLPKMLEEHKAIIAALNKLIETAKAEDKTDVIDFAEKLKIHARTEEEVTYPSALLIGQYLKLKSN